MWVHKGQLFKSHADIRRAFKNTSLPSVITDDIIASLGVQSVEPSNPDYDELTQVAEESSPVEVNGKLVQGWTVRDMTDEEKAAAKTALKAKIASRRYDEETRGIAVGGAHIKTDHASQMKVIGAALATQITPDKSRKWKAGNGFVQIDDSTIIAIAQAVDAHVQACFNREAELLAAVDSGEYTKDMINQGWPE